MSIVWETRSSSPTHPGRAFNPGTVLLTGVSAWSDERVCPVVLNIATDFRALKNSVTAVRGSGAGKHYKRRHLDMLVLPSTEQTFCNSKVPARNPSVLPVSKSMPFVSALIVRSGH